MLLEKLSSLDVVLTYTNRRKFQRPGVRPYYVTGGWVAQGSGPHQSRAVPTRRPRQGRGCCLTIHYIPQGGIVK